MRNFAPTGLLLLMLPGVLLAHAISDSSPDPVVPDSERGGRRATTPPPHAFTPCEHPWPCADGSEWPPGLEGPFVVGEPQALRIPVTDGLELEAYLWQPILPEGTRAPVVMHAQPYASQCYIGAVCFPRGDDPYWLDEFGLRPIIEAGFAVVNVNVRGTGTSGGCFEFNGPGEARDLAAAVEWLAAQPWSNGRVGMTGLSYMGTTPFLAANLNPPSLKTIVPGGIVSDEYTFWFTPQGAGYLPSAAESTINYAGLGLYPPVRAPSSLPAWASVVDQRLCPEVATMLTHGLTERAGDVRDATFFGDRAHVRGFPHVSAAVFIVHGLQDSGGHRFAEDAVWHTLERAPKRMLLGDWGHTFPVGELDAYPGGSDWRAVLVEWLDFWLKGVGEPARLGLVDYEDRQGTWRASTAWPPAEHAAADPATRFPSRHDEVHYLTGGRLAATPLAAEAAGFRSVPAGGDFAGTPFCGAPGTVAKFEGPVLEDTAVIAGNPHAYLLVESDGPAGLLAIDLYDIGPSALCAGGVLVGGEWLAGGTADLRFHRGNLAASAFPVGQPQHVRIDLANVAATVPAGHRLVAVASGYAHIGKIAAPAYPHLALHAGPGAEASHLVIPLVEGALGGAEPTLDYPPRPFVPQEDEPRR